MMHMPTLPKNTSNALYHLIVHFSSTLHLKVVFSGTGSLTSCFHCCGGGAVRAPLTPEWFIALTWLSVIHRQMATTEAFPSLVQGALVSNGNRDMNCHRPPRCQTSHPRPLRFWSMSHGPHTSARPHPQTGAHFCFTSKLAVMPTCFFSRLWMLMSCIYCSSTPHVLCLD